MPRVIGTRCGVNSTCTRCPATCASAMLHLAGVAVREQAVRGDVLVGLGEEARRLRPRPAPETPDTAFTTMPVGSTSPAREQRRQRERRRRSGSNRARRRARARRCRRGTARPSRTRTRRAAPGRCGPRRTSARRGRPAGGSRRRGRPRGRRVDELRRERLRLAVRQREEHDVEPGEVGRHRAARSAGPGRRPPSEG